jgi:hypothetical protein
MQWLPGSMKLNRMLQIQQNFNGAGGTQALPTATD